MLDIHAHILPGVDDGAADEAMAVEMLKSARRAGVDRLIATPHVTPNRGIGRCRDAYDRLRPQAQSQGIALLSGCELSVRALAGSPVSPEALAPYALGGTRFILLEFPADAPPVDWEYLLSDIGKAGYHVIIAHPERYRYIARDLMMAQELMNYGCELQIDARALLGGRFSAGRRTAIRLMDRGLASYIASDAHRPEDYDLFLKAFQHFGKKWPGDGLLSREV